MLTSATSFRFTAANQTNPSAHAGSMPFPRSCSPATRATLSKYAPGQESGLRASMLVTVEHDKGGYTIKAESAIVPGATAFSARIAGTDEQQAKALDAFASQLEQVGKRWAQQSNARARRIEDLYVP